MAPQSLPVTYFCQPVAIVVVSILKYNKMYTGEMKSDRKKWQSDLTKDIILLTDKNIS